MKKKKYADPSVNTINDCNELLKLLKNELIRVVYWVIYSLEDK